MYKINTGNGASTELDYYKDGYQREREAWIDAVGVDDKNRTVVILSETIFYPAGGGQKGDRGTITIPESIAMQSNLPISMAVVDTRKEDGFVMHILADGISAEAIQKYLVGTEKVKTEINWDFRHTQMRLHSSAHLIHCFMEKVLGKELPPPRVSDILEDRGINRYEINELLSADQLSKAVELMNEFTTADHKVMTFADTEPGRPAWARTWQCEEWKIPCGGVHPSNTKEIGAIAAAVTVKKEQTTVTFSLV